MIITETWMPISPLAVSENDQFQLTDTIVAGTTISALTIKVYLGNTDKTATIMPGSEQSYSGNRYTTKKIQSLVGGNTYVVASRVTIDGQVITRKCEIRVQKESDLE